MLPLIRYLLLVSASAVLYFPIWKQFAPALAIWPSLVVSRWSQHSSIGTLKFRYILTGNLLRIVQRSTVYLI